MLPDIFLQGPGFAAYFNEGALHRSEWTSFLVFRQIASTYPLHATVERTFHRVIHAYFVMLVSDGTKGIVMVAILAFHLAVLALFDQMVSHILTRERVPTFIGAWTQSVATAWIPSQMRLHCIELSHPFATFLVVRAMNFQSVNTLLKMDVTEVVEILGLA